MDDQLTYEYTFMMAEVVGEHGASQAEIEELKPELERVHQNFLEAKDSNELGFVSLLSDTETVSKVKKLATEVSNEFDTLVVLGIGGSDLGARAVHAALNHKYANEIEILKQVAAKAASRSGQDDEMDGQKPEPRNPKPGTRLYFAGDNTDPKELADLLDVLDWEQTAVNVISKSGDTVETMSAFVYLRQRLIDELGEEEAKRHIIVTTDAEKGSMRQIVDREGYRNLAVPNNVGGRFSVLSTVGLFPLAFAGIEIDQLLAGGLDLDEQLDAEPFMQNGPLIYAALQYLGYTRRQQNISVLMPYADGLRGLAQWYRQLWAESLGKKVDLTGKTVNVGQTPVAAVGATDQHSQAQLYIEGPFDKLVTFVTVEESSRSALLETDLSELAYLNGLELNDMLLTEAKSTAVALAHNGRPNGTITIPQLDEFYLGQLLYFFEVACAYMGDLLGINTYDQPGVELGKQLMYAQLGRQGFEDKLNEFGELLNPKKKFVA